ncbi:diguanylate cyclase [Acinetobacter sp. YH12063]|uniref:GGDEF domain-containing protein n=1 Tax=Acinetobacter sp. YH12063 TaxID=2601061 RepID=UPI0015D4496C|nr:GGDEF domain-containing protein [Acinetobacter sp. YH12063]
METLRTEHISKRLQLAMLVIVLSIVFISVPLIVSSYQNYLKNAQALKEIQMLKMVADLTNQISRERAPANSAMSSQGEQREQKIIELAEYRQGVDRQYQDTLKVLKETGFAPIAQQLESNLYPYLLQGRKTVDQYIALPTQQREAKKLDHAILAMFQAWDQSYIAMQKLVNHSHGKDTRVSNYYTLILLLAELRDQAGRVASNIMAAVSFQQEIPEQNLARSLQTQRQTRYLWELINVVQSEHDKTPEFKQLHHAVRTEFLDKGLPIIDGLAQKSLQHQRYHMDGTQLTDAMVNKFVTVVELQSYILDYSLKVAADEQREARNKLIFTLFVSLVSLLTALLTMFYAKKWVFEPLIRARNQLFKLARHRQMDQGVIEPAKVGYLSLFDAIQHIENMLEQRDAFEFQLKHIANTDSLTNVANRFALDEYIKFRDSQNSGFLHTALIVIDIDHFKQVNDRYGHIVGDLVIQHVANQLRKHIRSSDLVVRYGGDEFLVLIEGINMLKAQHIAETIRHDIQNVNFNLAEDEADLIVTVSIGVAVGAENWIDLLERADQALFKAKAAGRDRVSV